MLSTSDPLPLAPLQEIMLRDSLTVPAGGYHVEQVEIVLQRDLAKSRVAEAWADTVAATEALRTGFSFTNGIHPVCHIAPNFPGLEIHSTAPACMEAWLLADRCRAILFPDRVPWRMVFWPAQRRLVWTFHHALLDGRSIARVVSSFLTRLSGGVAVILPVSCWQPPCRDSIARGVAMFREIPSELAAVKLTEDPSPPMEATRSLGNHFLTLLAEIASKMDASAATLVTWAWGQAMAGYLRVDAVLVEQVRAGAPHPGTAGFTMNVLPLLILRSGPEGLAAFHDNLRAMRQIEAVSPGDFEAGVFPDVDSQGVSTIMVEHATLAHAVGHEEMLESIKLYERKADALMATAHLLPDFHLEVEGPHRHDLLARWIEILGEMIRLKRCNNPTSQDLHRSLSRSQEP